MTSFAFIPEVEGTNGHDFVLSTSRDRGVDIWRSPILPIHAWSARGELAIATGASYRLTPDDTLPTSVSNIDPWSLEIERAALHPIDHQHSVETNFDAFRPHPSGDSQKKDNETETEDDDDDPPRIGRVPFPTKSDNKHLKASNRESSLSAQRKLFTLNRSGGQSDYTPTPSRPRSKSPQATKPKRHVPADPKPARIADSRHEVAPVVTGSKKYRDTKPLSDMMKVMKGDISEVMRARVLCGYGVDSVSYSCSVRSALKLMRDCR